MNQARNKGKKIVAMFLVMLVLNIPLYSSIIFAQFSLSIDHVYGQSKVTRTNPTIFAVLKNSDEVNLSVSASGDNINENDVKIKMISSYGSGPESLFDKCEGSGNLVCTKSWSYFGNPNLARFEILLYNGSKVEKQTNFFIFKDIRAPEIVSLNIDKSSTDSKINVSYVIYEKAFSGQETSLFYGLQVSGDDKARLGIGLKNITILLNNDKKVFTKTFTEPSGVFNSYSENLDVDVGDFEGTGFFRFKVVDFYGNSNYKDSPYFLVDNKPPAAYDIKMYKDNKEISSLSNISNDITIKIYFIGDDLNQSTIKAKFSSLGLNGFFKDPSQCSIIEGNTTCQWNVAGAKINHSGSFEIPIEYDDIVGNEGAPNSMALSLTLDDEGPEYNNLHTSKVFSDGSYMVNQKTDFTVEVNELNFNEKPKLDLSSLNLGTIVASSCKKKSLGHYECYWNLTNINVADGKYIVKLIPTSDLFNNPPKNNLSINVTADTVPPDFKSDITIKKYPVAAQDNFGTRIIKGSSIRINFTAYDKQKVTAHFNLSSLINGSDDETIGCTNLSTNLWSCVYDSGLITTEAIGDIPLKITLEDESGNMKSLSKKVFVYGINNDTTNDFWGYEVHCSPAKLDRQISSLVNLRSYCTVTLKNKVPDVIPIKISGGDLKEIKETKDMVKEANLMNNYDGSTNPVIEVVLDTVELKVNTIDLIYPLYILSEYKEYNNHYVTKMYEAENITIHIPLYNLPLGEISNEYKKKILDVKSSSLVAATWIQSLQKMIHVLERICELISTFNSIKKLYADIMYTLDPISRTPGGGSTALAVKNQASGFINNANEALFGKKGIFSYCNYISCSKSLWSVFADKVNSEKVNSLSKSIKGFTSKRLPFNFGGKDSNECQTGASIKENINQVNQLTQNGCYAFSLRMFPSSPKNSLVLSMATLCIPGILNNLQKWRVIQCSYGNCLINSVKAGLPPKVCDDQKSYRECKYVTGEIFQVIPFVGYLKSLLSQVRTLLDNPISLIGATWNLFFKCKALESTPSTGIYAACWYPYIFNEAMEVFNQLKVYYEQDWTQYFGMGDSECDTFFDNVEDLGLDKEENK